MSGFELERLGWNDFFSSDFYKYELKGFIPARVTSRAANQYTLAGGSGEFTGRLSGKYLHAAENGVELPVAGDWVAVELKGDAAVIHAMLVRKSCFSRKPAISGGRKLKHGIIDGGTTVRQVLAANIDTAFIVTGLDGDFSPARIERYLAVAAAGGVSPVLLLNKADLCHDTASVTSEIISIVKDCPVHIISAASGMGMDRLTGYLAPGSTVAFLGSSGVGKSTIINRLFGVSLQNTNCVNAATGKGRHTTSRADLFMHESGCMLIDTPGIRELQLWCDEQALEESFNDVVNLSNQCRFSDCVHSSEPGCAVREALQNGTLSQARFESYTKLHSEVRHLEARKKQREISQGRRSKTLSSN